MRRKGEAYRFKSTLIDPNTQETNIYNDKNVARKNEGEWARSQDDRPPLGQPAPPCQVWLRASGIFLLGLSIFRHLGALVQKRKEKTLNLGYSTFKVR
jgi:hypothetical protein